MRITGSSLRVPNVTKVRMNIYGMCEMTPEKVINQNYLSLHGFCRQRRTTSLDIRVGLLHIIKDRQHKPGTPVTGLY